MTASHHNARARRRNLHVRASDAIAKTGLLRLRPLMFWLTPITRSPAQKPACKDLKRNGQNPAITLKAAYTPVSKHAGSRSLSITRSPAQKPAHKDLGRNDQSPAITPKATYAPVSNRAGSRSLNCRLQSKSKKFSCEFSI